MAGTTLYAEVILPLAVEGLFTYPVPEASSGPNFPGEAGYLSLSERREYSAIVYALHHDPPEDFKP